MSYSDVMSVSQYYSSIIEGVSKRSWFTPSSTSMSVAETPYGKPIMGSIKVTYQPGLRMFSPGEIAQANEFAKAQYAQNTRSTHSN
jgi:hypothetical protein